MATFRASDSRVFRAAALIVSVAEAVDLAATALAAVAVTASVEVGDSEAVASVASVDLVAVEDSGDGDKNKSLESLIFFPKNEMLTKTT